jgi:hypothetical protein
MRRRTLMLAAAGVAMGGVARAASKPVVLELFTSQGCSSCPPADALLGKLAQRPDIIALAWHVDYWDRLGWRDRFATRRATERQEAYARQLGTDVYTPALVVDGAKTVVGSDLAAIEAAIKAASPLPVAVDLTRTPEGMDVAIEGPGPLQALRVVYDPRQVTPVHAGENDGAVLHEFRVVREAEMLGEWDGGQRQFPVKPAGPNQGQVILVQSSKLRVVGAVEVPSG